jgi:hypothetical protein
MKNLVNCTTSDLDYFSQKKSQNIIRDGVLTYYPADLKSDRQATITIESSPHFLDLSKAQLYAKIKVYKFNKETDAMAELTNTDTISLTNNTLHSLWSQADLFLNDKKIENKMLYGLQSYVQDLMNYSNEAKESSLQAQGWFTDTPGELNNVTFLPETGKEATQKFNKGALSRKKRSRISWTNPHGFLF